MFGHRYFGGRYFAPRMFGPALDDGGEEDSLPYRATFGWFGSRFYYAKPSNLAAIFGLRGHN